MKKVRGNCAKFALSSIALALATASTVAHADAPLAPWLTQIGLTTSILSAANWGQGQLLATVDTGIGAPGANLSDGQRPFASGQISGSSACVALTTGTCNPAMGVSDNNGHGTAVMSLAIGNGVSQWSGNTSAASSNGVLVDNYAISKGMQLGVASNANGIAFKVANGGGLASFADMAAGITAAANASVPIFNTLTGGTSGYVGVNVINVSMTWSSDPTILNAINYAASKGIYIVWAGNNYSTTINGGANTTGLTPAALSHLIFAGAVQQNGMLSSYTDTPGTAMLGTGVSYASRWILAPGDNLLLPLTSNTLAYGVGSGTSFAAPIVAGSLLLVENAWPILKTNGTAENLLLATATSTWQDSIVNSSGSPAVYQMVAAVPAVYQTIPAVPAVYQTIPAVPAVYQTIPATPAVTKVIPAVPAVTVTVPAVTKTIPAVPAVTKTTPAVPAVTKVVNGQTVVVTPAKPATTVVVTPAVPAQTVVVTPATTKVVTPAVPAQTVVVTPAKPAQQVLVTPAKPAQQVLVTPAKPAQQVLVTPAVPAHTVLVTPAVPAGTVTTVTKTYGTANGGQGMLNLTAAFQPVGQLMAGNIAVSSLTTSVLAGGALGSLSAITGKLAAYTVLDSYQRNFTVNLSGLVAKTATAATLNPLPTNVNSGVRLLRFGDDIDVSYMLPMSVADQLQTENDYYGKSDLVEPNHSVYAMFTDRGGNSFAVGSSMPFPAQYTYSKMMYGSDDIATMVNELGTHLTAYTQSNNGSITAYGTQIGDFRITVGFNGTGSAPMTTVNSGYYGSLDTSTWDAADARSVVRGVSYAVNKDLVLGFSQTVLTEQHGLLGSTYDPTSSMSFGAYHVSKETSVSGALTLDAHRSLYVEYSQALTCAAQGNGGLISGNSALVAQSFGVSYSNKDVYEKDDKVSLTFKLPMQVTSGYTSMQITTVDPVTGVPTTTMQQVSLAPQAREMDFGVGYAMPLSKNAKVAFSGGWLKNYMGDAGTNVLKGGITLNFKM